MWRLGADRVDHHGQGCPGPGLDQPGGLAVRDDQADAGRYQVTQPGDHRGPGAVVAAEIVADADHHDRAVGMKGSGDVNHHRSAQ